MTFKPLKVIYSPSRHTLVFHSQINFINDHVENIKILLFFESCDFYRLQLFDLIVIF